LVDAKVEQLHDVPIVGYLLYREFLSFLLV
jgi:hypothetical protein